MVLKLYENTYITLDEAQQYFDERFNSEVWIEAADEDKQKALITASKRIDRLNFIGEKAVRGQEMEFPRTFCAVDAAAVPTDVKEAVCEEAIELLAHSGSVHLINQELGIQSVSLGGGSVSYKDIKLGGLLSKEAYKLVSKWLQKGFDIKNPEFAEAD